MPLNKIHTLLLKKRIKKDLSLRASAGAGKLGAGGGERETQEVTSLQLALRATLQLYFCFSSSQAKVAETAVTIFLKL